MTIFISGTEEYVIATDEVSYNQTVSNINFKSTLVNASTSTKAPIKTLVASITQKITTYHIELSLDYYVKNISKAV